MNILLDFIKGTFVGIANVIPGVSGGTMAVSFGIYDKLLSALSNIFKDFKNSIRVLLPIGLGMGFGVVGFTFIIGWLLQNQPFITSMAFTGLILGGIPTLYKSFKKGLSDDAHKSAILNILLFVVFAAFAIFLVFCNADSESGVLLNADLKTIIIVFFIGIIAAATMIIPGVSGSLVLMILGYYFGILTSVKDFVSALKDFDLDVLFDRFLILFPFGIGCLVGVFALSKLIQWLFNHFCTATYSAIFGLVITAPVSIFIKVGMEYSFNGTGILDIILGIVFLCVCGAIPVLMDKLEDKQAVDTDNSETVNADTDLSEK